MANPNTNTNHNDNGNTNESSNASDSIARQMRERAARHKRERERLSAQRNQQNRPNRANQDQSYRLNQGSRGRLSAMRTQPAPVDDVSHTHLNTPISSPSRIQNELQNPEISPNQNVESDYEYALRLQQQFEAMNTDANTGHHGHSPNHNSNTNNYNPYHPLPQQPDSGDVVMLDAYGNPIDSVAAHSMNVINGIPSVQPAESHVSTHSHSGHSHSHSNSHSNSNSNSNSMSHSPSHSQSTIDRDHEIALRLQREYDQQMQQIEDAQRQNQHSNFVPIEDYNQIPDSSSNPSNNNRGGFTSTFTINRNGNTQTFSFGNPSNSNRIRSNNGNGDGVPMVQDINDPFAVFQNDFFRNNGMSMGQSAFSGMGRSNDPFDNDFFRNARIRSNMNQGQPTAINLHPLQMNFLMGNGFGGFGGGGFPFDLMAGPPPPVANQQDIDANTSLDTYRVSDAKKESNDSNGNVNGKEEVHSDDDENKEDEGGKETCSICLEAFKDGDQIRRLPCFHIFHQHEIDRWLKTGNDKCPICRVPIDGQLRNQ